MRLVSDGFVLTKNAETSQPIWLYRVTVDGTPANDLFFAEYQADVWFFKTDGGVHSAQLYQAFPLSHRGVSQNSQGAVDTLEVSFGNVSREIQAFLESYDGLRRQRVTLRQVFVEQLADNTAYIEDVFYIDSCQVSQQGVVFRLSSRLDVLDVESPIRHYSRNSCPWTYKGYGCWVGDASPYTQPGVFQQSDPPIFTAVSIEHTSVLPSLDAHAAVTFLDVNLWGLNKDTDQLIIELYCDDPALLIDAGSYLAIGTFTNSGLYWMYNWYLPNIPSALALTAGIYKQFTIPFAGMLATGPGLQKNNISYLSWWQPTTISTKIGLKNAYIRMIDPEYDANTCNKTLEDCRRHGNQMRFGAFPNVPGQKALYVV